MIKSRICDKESVLDYPGGADAIIKVFTRGTQGGQVEKRQGVDASREVMQP